MSQAGLGTLSRQEIDALLRELGAELEREGVRGDLFVVGGAAMALAYNLRRITADVDAIFEPKEAVYRAARRIAVLHPELPPDWLNDAVKGFLPGNDPDAEVAIDAPGIRVSVASPVGVRGREAPSVRAGRDSPRPVGFTFTPGSTSRTTNCLGWLGTYVRAGWLPVSHLPDR
jgi:hypothetical protein